MSMFHQYLRVAILLTLVCAVAQAMELMNAAKGEVSAVITSAEKLLEFARRDREGRLFRPKRQEAVEVIELSLAEVRHSLESHTYELKGHGVA